MRHSQEQIEKAMLESIESSPLNNADEYVLLMNFFSHSVQGYQKLSALKLQLGDVEAAKYYDGMAEGVKHCMRNIYAFKDSRFFDPIT